MLSGRVLISGKKFLPAVSGFLIQKELEIIGGALAAPKRPLVAILGGSKVSSKIGVINNLLEIADTIIIGGGMAYTFSAAKGGKIGNSLFEADWQDYANEMVEKAAAKGVKLLLLPPKWRQIGIFMLYIRRPSGFSCQIIAFAKKMYEKMIAGA